MIKNLNNYGRCNVYHLKVQSFFSLMIYTVSMNYWNYLSFDRLFRYSNIEPGSSDMFIHLYAVLD